MLALDDGARRIGEFAFGLNDAVQVFTGETLFDEKIGGTIHLALGESYPESGGVNRSALHWDIVNDLRKAARSTPTASSSTKTAASWTAASRGPERARRTRRAGSPPCPRPRGPPGRRGEKLGEPAACWQHDRPGAAASLCRAGRSVRLMLWQLSHTAR